VPQRANLRKSRPSAVRQWALPVAAGKRGDLFTELAGHGRLLVVLDQPASFGALAIAMARSMNVEVGYLPGMAMRRIADLYPGEGKTDARDAFVIADARGVPEVGASCCVLVLVDQATKDIAAT
jgi:Transposase